MSENKIKVVKLSKKYQENITDIEKERKTIQDIIQNTFSKFVNENNYNTMDYALETLVDDYYYIPSDVIVAQGRYVRYLDLKKPMSIKLRVGGFVLHDNGYTLSLKGPNRKFNVSKNHILIFSQINDSDRIRAAVDDYINN